MISPDKINYYFGNNLRKFREAKGCSQEEFAEICKINHKKNVCSGEGLFDVAFYLACGKAFSFTVSGQGW